MKIIKPAGDTAVANELAAVEKATMAKTISMTRRINLGDE